MAALIKNSVKKALSDISFPCQIQSVDKLKACEETMATETREAHLQCQGTYWETFWRISLVAQTSAAG